MSQTANKSAGFGTAPVFFTAISTILGAILFLKFGKSVGTVGFTGTLIIIAIGHLVTIPTALAVSELATNRRVEGGGEYFIISRSFGLKIGATIGIALFLSQAISVAFYIIAFTEAFAPFFEWFKSKMGFELPRQAISVPSLILLGIVILRKGADIGVKLLYVVVVILAISLVLFFLGSTGYQESNPVSFGLRNRDQIFLVFAFIFPAFTGMTAGVGLSGDLKNPGKSIPLGSISATILGMIIYGFIAWKLVTSASPRDLMSNDLIMSDIALFGAIAIPVGLAASTISSALGSILVAPRTLQALGGDQAFPNRKMNVAMAKGAGSRKEPVNATIVTLAIALGIVLIGDVELVAGIITMFFMVTYGSICLISFLYHFGGDLSYRPVFRSRWYLSLLGFIMCVFLMFQINAGFALASVVLIGLLYLIISRTHSSQEGVQDIFKNTIFQLSRSLQIFLQRSSESDQVEAWRPSAICISRDSFSNERSLQFMNWISHKYGFGTFIHFIEGYFSTETHEKAQELRDKLIQKVGEKKGKVYVDTIISPSYTSAIAQMIQLPSISGKENNMVVFEYRKEIPYNLSDIVDNYSLVKAANNDVCILASTQKSINFKGGIHIWITAYDYENTNLKVLLSYVILSHPDWTKGHVRIFSVTEPSKREESEVKLDELITEGRLAISRKNVTVLEVDESTSVKDLINEHSQDAALTLIGFTHEQIKHQKEKMFEGYDGVDNVLFVNASEERGLS